ncbi:putative RNA-directed DNA polymerase [Helianthus annuus]|nr:putative RNA-directed DNA polymerase [Helianthus annuus]
MAGKGQCFGSITKYFVTNLPEGCTPWELRCGLERFGDITGTFIAKKRDKFGNRFGFVSFKNVRDRQELEKNLGGVKLGDCKLKVNIARFALENSGVSAEPEIRNQYSKPPGQPFSGNLFNLRDARRYCDVVGTSKAPGGSVNFRDDGKESNQKVEEKSVVVPDRAGAFGNLSGLALVGRTVDLETLVDFDRLLRIAKIVVANIQYLGGLSLFISFHDEDAARGFLEHKEIWKPWFSKLDVWKGQTLPLERVAWLKLCNIPLHLYEAEVMSQVGEAFGKVLHVPKCFEEDVDLSVARVGVLVGSPDRIREGFSLKWKDRIFRIWVEEEPVDWTPDSLGSPGMARSEDVSSEVAPPEAAAQVPEFGENEKSQEIGDVGGEEESAPNPNDVNACMHEVRENDGGPVAKEVNIASVKKVGPEEVVRFKCGSGERKDRPYRRPGLGQINRKTHNQSKGISDGSPSEVRPKKRSRKTVEDSEYGFGFVGFTNKSNRALDLNSRATSDETLAEDSIPQECSHKGMTGDDPGIGPAPEDEIEATVNIGAQVGVECGGRSDLFSKLLGVSETKKEKVSVEDIAGYWGSKSFGFDSVDSVGLSGGLACVWDSSRFHMTRVVKKRNFMIVEGKMAGYGYALNVINVYAPQSVVAKKQLWDDLSQVVTENNGFWVVMGDFNAVRFREEKMNCAFKQLCASNFNNFIFDTGLIEYNMRGRKFTYSSANGRKHSKLDRFLVNASFFNSWPEASVEAISSFHSDHSPIILKSAEVNFGARPFRVFDSWFDKPGFKEAVSNGLSKDFGQFGPADSRLMRKLCYLRADLKVWRDEMLKKSSEEVNAAMSDLENIQTVMEVRDLTEEEEWILLESKKVLKEEEERKNSDIRQRSRICWATGGDENSKFFHAMVNCRKASNVIHGLEVDGVWVSKPALVKKEVLRFFKRKFIEDCVVRPRLVCSNIKKVSDEDSVMLNSRFTKEEIKAAVFECGDDRAPGPDGINFRFVKRFWDLLENDFFDIMAEFFERGVINIGCGSSFIALVPKVVDPIGLKDFRPISLVGIINKVISKILANRLKKVLDSLISPSQSAFISGRYILDGPLIVNEIQNWIKKAKKKIFILKIDFEKAYDNLNWNFVLDILSQMGFSEKWCSWIKGVLSSARASVLVNGSPTFEFECQKGMRQGDPISPFLFVIVMEALSCMLNKASDLGILKGVSLPNDGPSVSHLFYADDAIIMGEWSRENVINVVRILRCFHVCSGLRINLGKSSLFGVGPQPVEVAEMAEVVGCSAESFPFKFLGLTVGANMNRVSNWRPVFDIFEKRLSLWKASTLSIGGRVTLIRSVLESLPTYFFSLYRAPVKVVQDLESIIRKFLWGGSSEVNKVHWVAWDRVASPIKMGGLGLHNLKDVNIALLAKWGWRFKNEQDSLWVKVVKALHIGNVWDFLPVKKVLGGVWSNIASVINRPLSDGVPIRNLFKGVVGRGDKILFWLDPWLFDFPMKDKFPALFRLEVVKNCSVRDRIEGSGHWLWKHDPEGGEELVEWQELAAVLASVSLSFGADKWKWMGCGSQKFSVAAVKQFLISKRDVSSRYVMEWCKWVPKKCNIFAWRADLDRIPTVEALGKRGVTVIDDMCKFCNDGLDSVSHIFSACPVVLRVFEKISLWCRIGNWFIFSFRDILEIHNMGVKKKAEREAVQGIMLTACWLLWKARNNLRFNGVKCSVEDLFSEIRIVSFFWYKHRAKKGSFNWVDWCKFVNM